MQEAGRYAFCALYPIGERPTEIGCAGASGRRRHRHEQTETKGAAGQAEAASDCGTMGHLAIIEIAGKNSVAIREADTGGTLR
jgi:hypothetical protein